MAEHDSPTTPLTVQTAGDLLRASLSPQQRDTSVTQSKYTALRARNAEAIRKLDADRVARKKSLGQYSQDAAVALSQGIVNTGGVAVSIADLLTRPSELQSNVNAQLGIPTTRTLSEIFNIDENVKRTNKIIEDEFMSERGQERNQRFATNTAEREAGKKDRIKKMVEEDGYNENIATAVDEAETLADTVMEFVDNPTLLIDETIKSIPLMLSGGVGAQGSKKLAALLKPGTEVSGVGGAATAIGVTEGASASGATKADVLKMTESKLYEGSEKYKELRETESHETARRIVANSSADRAFLIAAPIAAIAGKVTGAAKFEADIFTKGQKVGKAAKKTAKNTLSEAAEEGIQGTSGKLAENIAKKTIADDEQALSTGLGKGAGSGLAVGAAAGGSISAPKNILDAANTQISDAVARTDSQKATVAKAVEKGISSIKDDPEANINITLQAIAERNAVETVTEEEHTENLKAARDVLSEGITKLSALDEEVAAMPEGKEKKSAQKKLTQLKDQQTKAFTQYKQIQVREKAEVKSEDVEAAIESKNVDDFMGSFRRSPESVNAADIEAFKSGQKTLPEDVQTELDAHLEVEEAIKSMDTVSDNILNGSTQDRFLGIRNYQGIINSAMEANDIKDATKQLDQLKAFAEGHVKKAKVFLDAFAGDKQAGIDAVEIYNAKKGIIPQSRNAKFSKGLVEAVQKESIALNAAVKQGEARIGINQTKNKPKQDAFVPDVAPITKPVEATDRTPGSDKAIVETPDLTPASKDFDYDSIKYPHKGKKPTEMTDAELLEVLDYPFDEIPTDIVMKGDAAKASADFFDSLEVYEAEADKRKLVEDVPQITKPAKATVGTYERTLVEIADLTDRIGLLSSKKGNETTVSNLKKEIRVAKDLAIDLKGQFPEGVLVKAHKEYMAPIHKARSEAARSGGGLLGGMDKAQTDKINSEVMKSLKGLSKSELEKGLYNREQKLDSFDPSGRTYNNIASEIIAIKELLENPTTPAEVTKAEPVVTEAVPTVNKDIDSTTEPVNIKVNLIDSVLDTKNDRVSLKDKGFTARVLTEGESPSAIMSEPDLMNALEKDPEIATKYVNKDKLDTTGDTPKLTTNQTQAIKSIGSFVKTMNISFKKLFRDQPKNIETDLMQAMVQEDGTIPENIKTAIAMGAYNWVLSSGGNTLFNSYTDINAIFGRPEDARVSKEFGEMMQLAGAAQPTVVDSIGGAIMRSIGVQASKDFPENIKSNLEQALGAMGLNMLLDAGYITKKGIPALDIAAQIDAKHQKNIGTKESLAYFYRLKTHEVDGETVVDGNVEEITESNKDTSGLLDELFGIQSEATGPSKTANKNVAKKMRNTDMLTPKEVVPIIKTHQERAHYISREKMDKFLELDEAVQLEVMGYDTTYETTSHISERAGIKAKNSAIKRELKYMVDANEEFGDEAMYFTHEMTVQNRLLLVSNTFNPQGSKTHRHFVNQPSWNSEVDLDNQSEIRMFLSAFGASMGVKIDTGQWADYGPKIMTMVSDPKIMKAADAVLNNGDPKLFLPHIKEGAYSYDGLMNLGRYLEAMNGDRVFKTDLFLEADGVTNGVIIGVLNLAGGKDIADVKAKVALGGVITDGVTDSFGKYKKERNDSYENIRDKWKEGFAKLLAGSAGNKLAQVKAARKIFNDISRSDSKGGLIQTVYGAGESSIKEGVTDAFLKKFYDHVTDAVKADDQVKLKALSIAMNTLVPGSIKLAVDPMEQELSKAHFNKLDEFIQETYGEALVEAIDDSFGDFKAKGKMINTAMDIAFQSFMIVRAEAIKDLKKSEDIKGELSPNQLAEIDKGLLQAMPIMHSYFSQKSGNIEEGLFVAKFDNVRNEDSAYTVDQRYLTKPSGSSSKQTTTQGRQRVMIAPGASPTVLGVQSIDAATMLSHLQKMGALNVYDAIIIGQMEAVEQAKYINEMFMKVNSEYSIIGAAYDAMKRSLDVLHNYDPKAKLSANIELKGDVSLESFISEMAIEVPKVEAIKKEVIESVTLLSQYHLDGAETATAVTLPSNVPKAVVNEVIKEGIDFKKSSVEGIDIEQFHSDVTLQVTAMNATEVFESLGSIGSVKDTAAHTTHLKGLMDDIVSKVLDPLTLHMENDNQGEARGMTNGVDMYIINQTATPNVTVSGITTNGTRMSSQEVYSHEISHNIVRSALDTDTTMTRRVARLWAHARDIITVEDFMNPAVPDTPIERKAAQLRMDHIFDPVSKANGKSDHLHEFMAFAMTNARFRETLAKFSPNVGADFQGKNLLEKIASVFDVIMDLWHKLTVVKGNADITAQNQMDNLFRAMSDVDVRHKNPIISQIEAASIATNVKMNGLIIQSRKAVAKVARSKVFTESKIGVVKLTGKVTAIFAEDRAPILVDQVKRIQLEHSQGKEGLLGSIITELQGQTVDNAVFHDLNRIANMTVDQQRNHIKTLVSELSEDMYKAHTDGMTIEQKTAVTKIALNTDLGALVKGRTLEDIQKLVESDIELNAEINRLTAEVNTFGNLGNFYSRMSENLGHFMVTGKAREAHTLMNASQIAKVWVPGRPTPVWAAKAEIVIDQLATLYAIKYSDDVHRKEFSQVMLTEMAQNNVKNGVSFTLSMSENLKKDAAERLFVGHNAMRKGYTKETMNPHIAIEYGTLDKEAEMNRMGFFRDEAAKPLTKDSKDPQKNVDVYMFVNRHGGMSRFAAGTISKTGKVHAGANTFTTRIQAGDANPGVTGVQDIKDMTAAKQADLAEIFANPKQRKPNQEFAVPLFNHVGAVVGYRYMMSEHTKDTFKEKDNDFSTILGSTAASIQDKVSSKDINEKVIDALKTQFDEDFATQANGFVEIGPNSSDKDLREMYYMLPDETRRYLKQQWSGDTMYVKREQVNLIFGYRKFSITDVWHADEADLNGFQKLYIQSMDQAFGRFGASAYSGLKGIENTWQEVIKDIKDIIVIKTGVVTAMNTLSNTVSLRMLGVPMLDIVRDQAEAFRGAVEYQKDSKEIKELEYILANDQRPNRRTLDKQRIAVLKNQIAINPVRELVEAGVYQTIVEDIESTEGQFTYKSKFSEMVGDLTEPVTSKIPQGVKTVAKNMYMAHDSKTYKLFNQAAVLSDFTARYALHKHYTTRTENKLSSDDAIRKVVSIFIDYDLPTHKGIQYANDMGFMWFSKYNFRLQKILMETMSENPARVMMLLALQSSFGDVPSMYDNSVLTHDMTSMFRNPIDNLDTISQIAPINIGSSLF